MKIKQFEVWLANLNPRVGTEAGKTRPVLIVQTDLLNKTEHSTTIICPLTTNVEKSAEILRIHLQKGTANLTKDCDIMIDQLRAIDNNRLAKKIGSLPKDISELVKENIKIILDCF